ncbi:MAG: RNA pseudouridine synthase [Dongiaceae bacterium]
MHDTRPRAAFRDRAADGPELLWSAAGARPAAPSPPDSMDAHDLIARVLYRDDALLVLDKPAGLPVHAGPSGAGSLEDLLPALRFGAREDPALVHRLDRDTSGCLILARRRSALRRLNAQFAAGAVLKTYWAIARGAPPQPSGRIELPLAKRSDRRGWRMVVDRAGLAARTDYRLVGSGDGESWLELTPRTGRTHQIRVHLAAMGCPIVGDPVYGPEAAAGGAMMLHARAVRIPVEGGPALEVVAPPPPAFAARLRLLGLDPGAAAPLSDPAPT